MCVTKNFENYNSTEKKINIHFNNVNVSLKITKIVIACHTHTPETSKLKTKNKNKVYTLIEIFVNNSLKISKKQVKTIKNN